MSILVTGGAGYIGSHTCVELLKKGFDVIVADNLCNSSMEAIYRVEKITGKKIKFLKVELCDYEKTQDIFAENKDINSVIHFAGLKAVGESVQKPLEYYSNNLICTLNVLNAMKKSNVHNFVFSSSATVYGDPASVPITEDFPLSTTNPYGTTKLMIETILKDFAKANNDFNIAILRYFNPIGADESGLIGEDPNGIPNNLVPYVAQVAVGKLKEIQVFGDDYPTVDGTGVRDYIHVVDLAKGHIAALNRLSQKKGLFICNLGTGHGYSVLDIIHAYSKACGKVLPYKIVERRLGDIAKCWADTTYAQNELNWKAELDLNKMCQDSWNWQSKNPNGYNK